MTESIRVEPGSATAPSSSPSSSSRLHDRGLLDAEVWERADKLARCSSEPLVPTVVAEREHALTPPLGVEKRRSRVPSHRPVLLSARRGASRPFGGSDADIVTWCSRRPACPGTFSERDAVPDEHPASRAVAQLFISKKTVATHTQRILTKLDVHSRAEAVSLAYQHGLVNADVLAHAAVQ